MTTPIDDAATLPVNHDEAEQLAQMKRDESNLARCYLALRERISELSARVKELEAEVGYIAYQEPERQYTESLHAQTIRERNELRVHIAALTHERDWLAGERDEWQKMAEHWHPIAKRAEAERDAVRALYESTLTAQHVAMAALARLDAVLDTGGRRKMPFPL